MFRVKFLSWHAHLGVAPYWYFVPCFARSSYLHVQKILLNFFEHTSMRDTILNVLGLSGFGILGTGVPSA